MCEVRAHRLHARFWSRVCSAPCHWRTTGASCWSPAHHRPSPCVYRIYMYTGSAPSAADPWTRPSPSHRHHEDRTAAPPAAADGGAGDGPGRRQEADEHDRRKTGHQNGCEKRRLWWWRGETLLGSLNDTHHDGIRVNGNSVQNRLTSFTLDVADFSSMDGIWCISTCWFRISSRIEIILNSWHRIRRLKMLFSAFFRLFGSVTRK